MNASSHSTRRRFLQLGILGATTLTASARVHRHRPTMHTVFPYGSINQTAARRRRSAAKELRINRANLQAKQALPERLVSGDETSLPDSIGSFTKGLPHDALGRVDSDAWRQLLKALKSGNEDQLEAIPLGGTRKLANPEAAFAFGLAGADGHAVGMPAAPAYSSAWGAGEIIEVYAHALLRDVAFDNYPSASEVGPILDGLNALSDFRGPTDAGSVTAANLFRGTTPGSLEGNYISQFLLQPIPQGAMSVEQKIRVTGVGDDHMTTEADWLNILRGGSPTTVATFDPEPRYISTGRDLGDYVHNDYPYQAYLNAALILLNSGAPVNPANPFINRTTSGAFVTFGAADILSRVAEVSHMALRTAWAQKWLVHRRVRPEVFGGRIHQKFAGSYDSEIHQDALESPILEAIHQKHGTRYLPLAYPEGSPTHPAYPAGHAVIAGACTTVLKAFFDGSHGINAPVQVTPGSIGTELEAYHGVLTVEGELNKLADNIAIGRNIAGVHWRTDGHEGLLLGEKVAVAAMRDWLSTTGDTQLGITFNGFDGAPIAL